MSLPFDLQKFSSEIVTAVVVFSLTKAPAWYGKVRSRLRPDIQLPALECHIRQCRLQIQLESGEASLYIELLNRTKRALDLEELRIVSWNFNSMQMPTPSAVVTPVRARAERGSTATFYPKLRLHKEDVQLIRQAAGHAQAANVLSTPLHGVRLEVDVVVKRRMYRAVQLRRYLEFSPVTTTIQL